MLPSAVPSCSKGPRGLSVLPRVGGIFTSTTISLNHSLRQLPSRYAIPAGRYDHHLKTQTHTDNHRRATDRPSSTATPTTPRPQGTDHHLGARTPSTANLDQSRCGRAHPRAPRGRGGFPRGTGPRKTGEAAVREAPTRGQDRGARARAGTAEREEAASADARGRPGSRDAGRARHTDNRPHV